MRRTLILSLVLLCALMGIVDASYLAESALTDTALSCNIQGLEGCNTVAQSPYAYFIGIPLGIYGIAFYVLIFIGTLVLRYLPNVRFDLVLPLRVLSGLGAIASIWFLWLQFFVIQAFCIYCLLSAVLSFIIFGLLLALRKPSPVPTTIVVG